MKRQAFQISLILSLFIATSSVGAPTSRLVVGTWPDYLAPELVSSFEEKFDTKIEFIYFNSEDDRHEQIIKYGTNRFDVVTISGFNIPLYQRLEWIEPLSKFEIPNLKHIGNQWLNKYADLLPYGVPYFWGVTGIAYRKDKVDPPPTSWEAVLKPKEEHRDAIRLIDDITDIVSICFHYLGVNTPSPSPSSSILDKTRSLLKHQKHYISSYEYIGFNKESTLITGKDHMAFAYSGDAATLNKINDKIGFVVPHEGANIWMDFWAVMKNTKQPKLVEAFLHHINEPKYAAINAEFVNYPTPNTSAMVLTSDSYQKNPMIFLSNEELSRTKPYIRFAPHAIKEINSIAADIVK